MFKDQKKGIFGMIGGSLGYAFYPILISISVFSGLISINDSLLKKFLWGFVLVGGKEIFNLFYQLIYVSIKGVFDYKKMKSIFTSIPLMYKKIFKEYLNNRYGWLIVLASILAGPIGYSIETTGILLSGPSLGTLLVNLVPIFIVLAGKFFIKDKISFFSLLMITIIVMGVIANSMGQYFVSDNSTKGNVFIALVTGAITAILWSLENIIMGYASTKINSEYNHVVVIKLSSSALIIPILIIPLIGLTQGLTLQGYSWYGQLFNNLEWFIWLLGIGFIMFLARNLYFLSITHSSPIISSLTLIIRFIFVPFLELIVFNITGKQTQINWAIFIPISALTWLAITLMIMDRSGKIKNKFTRIYF